MELTNQILTANGFVNNHPERLMSKFYFHGTQPTPFRIKAEQVFHTLNTAIGYSIVVDKYDSRGAIVKTATVGPTNDIEDLQSAINLCGIEKTITV